MNKELEINNRILFLTNKIKKDCPELIKYIAEIPVKGVFTKGYEVSTNSLIEYYNTLKIIFDEYVIKHPQQSKCE